MKYKLLLIAVACFFQAGCATMNYQRYFSDTGDVRTEFASFDDKYRIYNGVIAENIKYGNGLFYQLQFEGPLEGEDRFLNVYVPYNTADEAVVAESDVRIEGKTRSFMFLERTCCNSEYHNIINPPSDKAIPNPSGIINSYMGSSVRDADFPVIFCRLGFSTVSGYSMQYVIWRFRGRECFAGGETKDGRPYSRIRVRWSERSVVKYAVTRAGFILPVIFDVATSPIQLLGAGIYYLGESD
ncbi:MAG: hypothetical protein MUD12_09085 [Spirochaetes bacterium]|jgi:hypothetical protein|nr:hypothetical protein [Spirochaetota bacterium]